MSKGVYPQKGKYGFRVGWASPALAPVLVLLPEAGGWREGSGRSANSKIQRSNPNYGFFWGGIRDSQKMFKSSPAKEVLWGLALTENWQ